ncbi:MAG: acetyl-CoA carboxylase biotin carboxyl carrier protein subunit [Bacteroidia bacterium]
MKIHWKDQQFEPQLQDNRAELNGELWELIPQTQGRALMVGPQKTMAVEIISIDRAEKTVVLQYKGIKHSLRVSEPLDDLLKSMGLDNAMQTKIAELKAPMPGLVLDVLVNPGQEVKKGDKLLVLEAMKMENAIKAPADLTISAIKCQKGQAVDKNQVLLSFD